MYSILTHGLAFITAVIITIYITRKQSIYYVRKQIRWDLMAIKSHGVDNEALVIEYTNLKNAAKVIDKYIEELEEEHA